MATICKQKEKMWADGKRQLNRDRMEISPNEEDEIQLLRDMEKIESGLSLCRNQRKKFSPIERFKKRERNPHERQKQEMKYFLESFPIFGLWGGTVD